jgi:Tfp pilus assembly protein PilO
MELYRREREDRMSPTSQLATLFGQINAQARESGSTTTHFDPQGAKSMELLQRVPVKMNVVGSFPEICRLLADLEKMPETIWVDQLTLKRSQESGKNIEGELKLEVFTVNSKKSG